MQAMEECPVCAGLGVLEECPNGHQGLCPCAAREYSCARCGGAGDVPALCKHCGEAPATVAGECAPCADAGEEASHVAA
jgi:hypothetical protein